MFNKILIANRGEIACRIIRACQKLGVKTVAVYSDPDVGALHVLQADEAYPIGPAPASESYLNIVKIIEVARSSQSEAIHPGYGFLSENAAFALACREAGIKFIGPSPDVLARMSDKLVARNIAKKAGLPTLPGTSSVVGDRNALKRAKKLGFPLMVKAAEGGGGIGMQIVYSPEELDPIIDRARHQARSSFGSSKLYFERYLEHASHIEVQIIADEDGKVVHLLERDCSVQRRNQKILEIAPSMKLNAKQRKSLSKNAVKLAKHIGYTNAGTVEFLVSSVGETYFLEMNKRLQVEHGITEMITGMNLVETQICIAAGQTLPFKQKEVKPHGYAAEARIYAEDPSTFLPSAGVITKCELPQLDENVRLDSCVYTGYEVGIHYDPLLGKLMCWGETRDEARTRLLSSLAAFKIEGVRTNIPTLQLVLESEEFVAGNYDTGLVSMVLDSNSRLNSASQSNGTSSELELAAAAAVAIVASSNGTGYVVPSTRTYRDTPWKNYGRGRQMTSGRISRSGWG